MSSTNPRELRFIASAGGLADAYAGLCSPEQVVHNIERHWFRRVKPSGRSSGLFRRVSDEELSILAREYVEGFANDPFAASRRFAETIVSARTLRRPDKRWVDTTPANARAADRVLALFPEGRVVHMMRDGRDVAASFATKSFGPREVMEGLDAWRDRLIEAHNAESRSPAGTVLRVDLTALAVTHRDDTLDSLMAFLDLPEDAFIRDWFDANVIPAQANVGRWRHDYDDDTSRAIDARYEEILAELDGLGVHHP